MKKKLSLYFFNLKGFLGRMPGGPFIIFSILFFTAAHADEISCPENAFSSSYTNAQAERKYLTCQIKVKNKYYKHGPQATYDLQGQLLNLDYFKMDKPAKKEELTWPKKTKSEEIDLLNQSITVEEIELAPGEHKLLPLLVSSFSSIRSIDSRIVEIVEGKGHAQSYLNLKAVKEGMSYIHFYRKNSLTHKLRVKVGYFDKNKRHLRNPFKGTIVVLKNLKRKEIKIAEKEMIGIQLDFKPGTRCAPSDIHFVSHQIYPFQKLVVLRGITKGKVSYNFYDENNELKETLSIVVSKVKK